MTDTFDTFLLALMIALAVGVNILLHSDPPLPRCTEDVVLVGQGDFDNGRWDYYVCGPALDDFGG